MSRVRDTRTRAYRDLTAVEKLQALARADELLLVQATPARIVAALQKRWGMSRNAAQQLISEAEAEAEKEVRAAMGKRRAVYLRSLQRLFERAVQGEQYGAAVATARLQADVEGHKKPERVTVSTSDPATEWEREAEHRSVAELDYYAEHGCWPEQGGNGKQVTVQPAGAAVFPLTRH